ncbi:MAG: hypothetical protein Q4P13_05180 [Psychrobacter sp.]|nr:hypothetical protein [Psychrobacter sp.]
MTIMTSSTSSNRRLYSALSATIIAAAVTTQASAMLPTPEPELNNPSSLETAAIARQNTTTALTTAQSIMGSNAGAASNNAASNANAVVSKITAAIVSVDANGQETLVPVDANTKLQSGNVIEYQGYFTNTNKDRVRKMTVTMSIPEQVELLKVISPAYPQASVDNNVYGPMPLKGMVNGQAQDIPLTYYRSVRWDIEGLGLNDTAVAKYRARVK